MCIIQGLRGRFHTGDNRTYRTAITGFVNAVYRYEGHGILFTRIFYRLDDTIRYIPAINPHDTSPRRIGFYGCYQLFCPLLEGLSFSRCIYIIANLYNDQIQIVAQHGVQSIIQPIHLLSPVFTRLKIDSR